MDQRIGSCSICGGDVVHWVGAWMSTNPPPAPHCIRCGAVSAASQGPVIPMVPRRDRCASNYPFDDPAWKQASNRGDIFKLLGLGLPL